MEEVMSMINGNHEFSHGQGGANPRLQVPEQSEQADAPDDGRQDINTRKAFNLLRESYDNTHAMIEDFLPRIIPPKKRHFECFL